MKDRVLLLGIDGTQTLPIAKSLYKRGNELWGIYSDKNSYGFHTKYIKHKIKAPSYSDEKDFVDFLIGFLENQKIDLIIPLGDQMAKILSNNKKKLLPLSNYIMPDIDVFMRGYDKNQLMTLCRANKFPHPITYDLNLEYDKVDESIFPALIKPNIMTGGRGMVLVRSYEEFVKQYPQTKSQYGECHLQEFIQVGGRQIKVQVFMSNKSEPLYYSVIHKQRYYPENGGSSCCNTTIDDVALSKLCSDVLKNIGWIGFADFDLIEDPKDGIAKIMEINPRVPACVKSVIESGIDYGEIIADATLGRELKKYEYRPGVILRHLGFEILWFIKSKNRWNTQPFWFKFFGKRLHYQDLQWTDPNPFLLGTFGNIKKQMDPEFRKSKSGLK